MSKVSRSCQLKPGHRGVSDGSDGRASVTTTLSRMRLRLVLERSWKQTSNRGLAGS